MDSFGSGRLSDEERPDRPNGTLTRVSKVQIEMLVLSLLWQQRAVSNSMMPLSLLVQLCIHMLWVKFSSVCLNLFRNVMNICAQTAAQSLQILFSPPCFFFICCPLCWHSVSHIYLTGSLTQKLIRLRWFEFKSGGEIASLYQCLLTGDSQLQCIPKSQSSVTKRHCAFFPISSARKSYAPQDTKVIYHTDPPTATTCAFKPHTGREASKEMWSCASVVVGCLLQHVCFNSHPPLLAHPHTAAHTPQCWTMWRWSIAHHPFPRCEKLQLKSSPGMFAYSAAGALTHMSLFAEHTHTNILSINLNPYCVPLSLFLYKY